MNDLATRSISAAVLLVIALGALVAGGWVFAILCGLVGFGVLIEFYALARRFTGRALILWLLAALIYVGGAVLTLVLVRFGYGATMTAALMASVWAADIGAYFTGRTIGGPKLAPRLSPNKTWSGLAGAMVGAAALLVAFAAWRGWTILDRAALAGVVIGVVSQAGDLFESWMKRRAGVKDSGRLIPGHGGLFDRLDGLLAVAFVFGVLAFVLR